MLIAGRKPWKAVYPHDLKSLFRICPNGLPYPSQIYQKRSISAQGSQPRYIKSKSKSKSPQITTGPAIRWLFALNCCFILFSASVGVSQNGPAPDHICFAPLHIRLFILLSPQHSAATLQCHGDVVWNTDGFLHDDCRWSRQIGDGKLAVTGGHFPFSADVGPAYAVASSRGSCSVMLSCDDKKIRITPADAM